jgi:hypothetical protein
MRSPYAYLISAGGGGAAGWTGLDLSASSAGQDVNSQISGVTSNSVTIANGAAAYTSVSGAACRYWDASGVITGAGLLMLELELSAAIPYSAAIGIGMAADGDDLTTSPSMWAGRKLGPTYPTFANVWAKWGTAITTNNNNQYISHRIIGVMAICDSDGSVATIYDYSRDDSGSGQAYTMNPSQASAATGTFSEFILTAGRTDNAGSATTVSIAGIRYQFIAAN